MMGFFSGQDWVKAAWVSNSTPKHSKERTRYDSVPKAKECTRYDSAPKAKERSFGCQYEGKRSLHMVTLSTYVQSSIFWASFCILVR